MTRGRMRYQSPAACCWQLYRVTLWRSPCATTSRALDPHRCEAARLKQRWNYPVSLHLPSNQPLSLSLSLFPDTRSIYVPSQVRPLILLLFLFFFFLFFFFYCFSLFSPLAKRKPFLTSSSCLRNVVGRIAQEPPF